MTTQTEIQALLDGVATALYDAEPSPTRQAPGGRSSSGRDRLPINPRLADARHHLKHTLTSWALLVSEESDAPIDCDDTSESTAAWLYQHADFLATHPAAADFTTEIRDATTTIIQCIDTADDRVLVGTHAGMAVYARAGDKTITLPDGTTRTVKEMRDHLRHDLVDEVLPAAQCAGAVNVLHDVEITAKQIRKTYENDDARRRAGKIGPHAGLRFIRYVGREKAFRVGDVATRLVDNGRRRVS